MNYVIVYDNIVLEKLVIVEMYKKENGVVPVKEFILSLNNDLRGKAFREIDILRDYGTDLREPYVKAMKGKENKGIFELRIRFASDSARIFYFFFSNNKAILLNGFIKKTNRTPIKELKLAREYKNDYERRVRYE